jgi:hypothetical protein
VKTGIEEAVMNDCTYNKALWDESGMILNGNLPLASSSS